MIASVAGCSLELPEQQIPLDGHASFPIFHHAATMTNSEPHSATTTTQPLYRRPSFPSEITRFRNMTLAVAATMMLAACGDGGSETDSSGQSSGSAPHRQIGAAENVATAAPSHGLQAKDVVRASTAGIERSSRDYQRLYGPGVFNMNSLANIVVGDYNNYNRMISNRFMATRSGNLSYIKLLLASGTNYSKGTGGTIRVTIRPDDGSAQHLPNMNVVLASAVFRPNLGSHPKSTFPRDIQFPAAPWLQAGRLYHVLIENIDPNSANNYISVDYAVTHRINGRPSRWLNSRDWSTLMASRPLSIQRGYSWYNLTERGSSNNLFSPIMELGFSNGQVEGVGDMESGSVIQRTYTANAQRPIRERFTPSQNMNISGISIATAASVAGSLRWRVLHNGVQLDAGTISQHPANYQPIRMNSGTMITNMVWYDVNLNRNIPLRAGQSYDIEFTPQGGSQWVFAPHRNGAFLGFKSPAAFNESRAQHTVSGAWVNTSFWNYSRAAWVAHDIFNWPVVLHRTP